MILRKYGVSTTIVFPLVERGTLDFVTGATTAAGDIKISKDGGAANNTTDVDIDEIGQGMYKLTLSVAEMQAAKIILSIVDQSETKVFEDQCLIIETYGHASAEHAFDLDTASPVAASVTGNVGGIAGTKNTLDDLNDISASEAGTGSGNSLY